MTSILGSLLPYELIGYTWSRIAWGFLFCTRKYFRWAVMDLEAHKKRKLQDPEAPESVKKQRREESPTSPDVPKPTEEVNAQCLEDQLNLTVTHYFVQTEPHVASLITASPLKNKVGTLPHSTGTDANGNHGVATSECTRSKVKRALRLEESCDDALFSPPLNFTAEIGL